MFAKHLLYSMLIFLLKKKGNKKRKRGSCFWMALPTCFFVFSDYENLFQCTQTENWKLFPDCLKSLESKLVFREWYYDSIQTIFYVSPYKLLHHVWYRHQKPLVRECLRVSPIVSSIIFFRRKRTYKWASSKQAKTQLHQKN